jgi:ubiquitin
MDRDYLQDALMTFNGGNWYSWKKEDDNGNKISNSERMQYQHIKIIKDGATMPTKAEVDAKIAELKQAEQDAINKKASTKSKLLALGLTEEEIKLTFGL